MFNVKTISEKLGVEPRTVRYYISRGFLKASMNEAGSYEISIQDLEDFEESYFYSERFSNKGLGKTITKEKFSELESFIEAIKNGIDLKELFVQYGKLEIKIPSLSVYLRYQRDEQIIQDTKNGERCKTLAKKYNLCEKSIENILRKNRESQQL